MSSEGSGKSAHMHRLARAFPASTHKAGVLMKFIIFKPVVLLDMPGYCQQGCLLVRHICDKKTCTKIKNQRFYLK